MTEPATKPCEFCHGGSVIDSNGAAWRCAECNGTGRVRVDAGGVEDDDVPFLSDERLALVRAWCAPRKDAA